jgi:hypothetical protein
MIPYLTKKFGKSLLQGWRSSQRNTHQKNQRTGYRTNHCMGTAELREAFAQHLEAIINGSVSIFPESNLLSLTCC